MAEPLHLLGATELSRRLASRDLSARALAEALLARAATCRSLGAFNTLDAEDLLRQADASDARRATGATLGPLDGIPVGIKDNIAVRGQPLTCSSRMLAGYVSPYDSAVAERLRAAGALLMGRLNMDEFAMGSSTETSATGLARNPWDPERTPGGSSGGSAACLASGQAPLALGSDTGGSIRQPAAHCGLVGLKPTYGLVSRHGLVAFASSLDQIGPMARSVDDCELLLGVLAGPDARDMNCLAAGDRTPSILSSHRKPRLGVPRALLEGVAPGVRRAFDTALDFYRSEGCELIDISLPTAALAVPAYYVVATAEASSNLARYDGIRYGHRAEGAGDIADLMSRSRAEGFGAEVKRRILLGTFVLSAGFSDAYYGKALAARASIRAEYLEALSRVDALITPTVPSAAFRLGEKVADPLQMYLEDLFTIPANLAGLPALSVPAGMDGALPVGIHLVGAPLAEGLLLELARRLERSTGLAHRVAQP
jgi:aspartyl-tRNA(Asn)/glutamyl-tRNA(Gln) amidotransferase subunit A